jgi:hypothetical protein
MLETWAKSPVFNAAVGVAGLVLAVVSLLSSTLVIGIALIAVVVILAALAVLAVRAEAAFDGPYRLLDSETRWDLGDPDAKSTLVSRRQEVKFNYRTWVVPVTAYNDTGYDCLATIKAKYGSLHGDTKVLDGWHHAVIWLHKESEPGKHDVLEHEYTEVDCFTRPQGESIAIDGTQRGKSSLLVVFPQARPPLNVTCYRTYKGRRREKRSLLKEIRDFAGRKAYRISRRRMKLGETYIVEWDWEEPKP